ncbi:hypothetical protein [Chitinophaga sp. MM2321]|uniref:hypothetical protein n=1 Tax=Chitinophaga sp. MM2321 TaxID=3137178 RepID=UPI0032D59CA0
MNMVNPRIKFKGNTWIPVRSFCSFSMLLIRLFIVTPWRIREAGACIYHPDEAPICRKQPFINEKGILRHEKAPDTLPGAIEIVREIARLKRLNRPLTDEELITVLPGAIAAGQQALPAVG